MSSSVVPFHPGMRLGQGYNTFTQETTINDAVQKLDGVRATDGDLQHAAERFLDAKETVTAPEILSTPTGHLARQTGKVSQTIKWEALIIRHLSDVTKRMDLSGAHIIKNDARGTNTKVRGYFVDEVAFGNADLNYLFHVDVVNQKLVAHEVNQFVPLRNVPPARFTEVYGDGFVSGFLEGGTFNALVSVKLTQSTPPEAFERAFTSALGIGRMGSLGFNEVGHSTGSVSAADLLSAHETSTSVSWTGGGKIRPVDATDWDIVSLKEAAMNFPDAVAECPDRVSAIITKYTALRSFYQQSRRGVPLTYENAGFYAHGLMDQYTDYKVLSSRTRACKHCFGRFDSSVRAKGSQRFCRSSSGYEQVLRR
ncbi:uncharacterized protein RCC_06753 [Ramularia collo-cygni]|uniref:Uncharacterized protein n=1 Tax=Ramularia collo-cygni TaxID=112498 RepID=A0A2D3VDL7_9PEZI|nr:uncharacterized protein RCC_06753 [Ramularia collo-cygni]CZT20894.1 uncharacterized protein RCC_06753 [Ramularia collo-cygni]